MEKQLAEVVDGTEIKEITETQILCSCENDGVSNMCSSENDHTYRGLREPISKIRMTVFFVQPEINSELQHLLETGYVLVV